MTDNPDHCKRQLHTFKCEQNHHALVTVCELCQAETHSDDHYWQHMAQCPANTTGIGNGRRL